MIRLGDVAIGKRELELLSGLWYTDTGAKKGFIGLCHHGDISPV